MKKKSLPKIKKEIKNFLSQEEGNINKNNAAKIGMSLLVLGISMTGIMKSDPALGACSHISHGSHGSHGSHVSHGAHGSHGSHVSHGSHASHSAHGAHGSHGSHSSHGRGGWC